RQPQYHPGQFMAVQFFPLNLFALRKDEWRRLRATDARNAPSRAGRRRNRVMRVRWSYCLGGIGLAAASFVVGLEVEKATARSVGSVSTTIVRSFKGDHLAPAMQRGVRPSTSPNSQPKVLDGCESSASTIRIKPI